jgi:Uma2 family endonuclease
MAMSHTAPWTLEDLDLLPEDRNRYELLDGELVVTPPPSDSHEHIVARLGMMLVPFVVANRLGLVHHPRAVVQFRGEQVEPDLMVRREAPLLGWANAPLPSLVVEVTSRSTRHLDLGGKRRFYAGCGVPEYWIVDREDRVVVQVRGDVEHRVSGTLRWAPEGASAVLEIDVEALWRELP